MREFTPIDISIFSEGVEAVGQVQMRALCSNMIRLCFNDLDRLSSTNFEEFKIVCHRIAGAAAPCGATHLSRLASAKENGTAFSQRDLGELREAVMEAQSWYEQEAAKGRES